MAEKKAVARNKPTKYPAGVWTDLASRFKESAMGQPLAMLRIQAVELLASFVPDPAFPIKPNRTLIDANLGENARAFRKGMADLRQAGMTGLWITPPDGLPRQLPEIPKEIRTLPAYCTLAWLFTMLELVHDYPGAFPWDAAERLLAILQPGGDGFLVDVREIEADACRLLAKLLEGGTTAQADAAGAPEPDARGSFADVVRWFNVPQERQPALRAKLKRWRKTTSDGWTESTTRNPNEPSILYIYRNIQNICQGFLASNARPTKKG